MTDTSATYNHGSSFYGVISNVGTHTHTHLDLGETLTFFFTARFHNSCLCCKTPADVPAEWEKRRSECARGRPDVKQLEFALETLSHAATYWALIRRYSAETSQSLDVSRLTCQIMDHCRVLLTKLFQFKSNICHNIRLEPTKLKTCVQIKNTIERKSTEMFSLSSHCIL